MIMFHRIPAALSRNRWSAGSVLAVTAMGMGLMSCSNPSSQAGVSASNQSPELTLVSFAVTQKAYEQIVPKFAAQWKQKTGQTVKFNQSYGGSGSQTRAVIDGLEADVVALALALDVQKIEKAGLIQPKWENEAPEGGIVTRSVAALVTRKGGPQVQKWSDLTKDGIQVITANPKTSGGARWNYLALWGAVTQTSGSEDAAKAFVKQVYQNAPVLPRDAREASDVFYKQGQGNVLINYENEVLLAKQEGKVLPYVVPTDVNISIDNPVAVVDKTVDARGTRKIAEAFVQFLYTPEAQREFAKVGFRPVNRAVAQEFATVFPKVQTLFTVQDLGGWNQVQTEFFADNALFDQMQIEIAQAK
jgi:sulfate/thiosulfate transport system substrate-binding protein